MTKTILLGRSAGRWCKCCTLALFAHVIAATFALEARGDVSENLVRDIRTLESLCTVQTSAMSKLATSFRVRLAQAKGDMSAYPEKMRETRSQESGELLECELEVSEISDELERFVVGCGGVVVSSSVRWKIMHVRLPLSSLESVAEREDVLAVRRAAGSFKKKTNTSRGDTAHKAASARQIYGVSGRGVKIGVMSDSVRHMSDVQASGDLPSSVDVLDDGIGIADEGEGTAMLEIVHDLAPNAGLAFCACGSSQAQMADNIARLANAGCRVVVDDIGFFAEPTFSSGPIEVAATEFVRDGGVYATSAGNAYNADAGHNGVWEGLFTASSNDAMLHEFSAGNSMNKLTYQNRPLISLEWNDAWNGSSNDYALYLYDVDGNVVAYSDDAQSGLPGHHPQEMLHTSDLPSSYKSSFKGLFLAVRKKSAANVRRIRINTFGGSLAYEQGGSTYGHSCAEKVLSVGAASVPSGTASFSPTTVPTNYSSDGPAWRFFDVADSAIAGGRMLRKPDVLGAAKVACATPGFEEFSGTSAAAPHIAAIVGLMLEANAEMTYQDVFEVLTNSTFSTSGWSPSAGYGALNAEAAVSNAFCRAAQTPGRLYVATNGNDKNDGRSWATAKRTIQAAVTNAEEGATIFVGDGRYIPFSTIGKNAVTIRSVNGAEKTCIDGRGMVNVSLYVSRPDEGKQSVLIGFSVTNGYSSTRGGGVVGGVLSNCVLRANKAKVGGGGAAFSTLCNCLVADNTATNTSAGSSAPGGGTYQCRLVNCTVVGNSASEGGGTWNSTLRNCIVWDNHASAYEDIGPEECDCSYTCTGTFVPLGDGNFFGQPCFVSAATGDYRLEEFSQCIDAGCTAENGGGVDLDGNPRVVGAAVDLGAYEWQGAAAMRPVNDNFADATAISGASGSLTASSENATQEMGEPYHGITSATNSVWWKWTASAAGSMTITTEGSGFDTGLGVYTGSSVSALTKIDDNDDNGAGGLWSSVTFSAVAGTTYYIAAAGYKGATGSVKLNWNIVSEGSAPSIGLTSLYAVIDLSAGPTASSYPVSELEAVPQGGWTEEHKTTKLVLRRIAPGTFVMGNPSPVSYAVPPVNVTFTNAFYAGVFAVTQRQWELVMGKRPSYFSNDAYYASRPVESVSWNQIRGSETSANWPSATGVSDSSFIGVLRRKTGLSLDLPTEAQWEYACRAGTTTELNSGKSATSANMSEVGRCADGLTPTVDATVDLSLGTPKVGSYQPNDWGLYDMHGVIGEWCLDYYLERNKYPTAAVTNPFGPVSGTFRVHRGGSWYFSPSGCASSARTYDYSSTSRWSIGLRVFCSSGVTNVSPGLSVPTGLSAADGSSSSSVFVSWNAVVGATSYTIWRSTTPDVSQAVKIATVTGTSYSDSDPAYYAVSYYWVKAENASEESGFSAPDSGYRYQANTYLLRYDANGGTGEMEDSVRRMDSVSALGVSAFRRDGFVQVGWALTSSGSLKYRNTEAVCVAQRTGQIATVYAVWLPADDDGFAIVDNVVEGWCCRKTSDVVIPAGTTTVRPYAFAGTDITSVVFPDTLGKIGDYAFNKCLSLTNITFGTGLKSFGSWTFQYCERLTGVFEVPEGVTNIAVVSFMWSGVGDVVLPRTIQQIDKNPLVYASQSNPMTNLWFRGDAPSLIGEEIFRMTSTKLLSHVPVLSTGWKDATDTLPDKWPVGQSNARGIVNYSGEPPAGTCTRLAGVDIRYADSISDFEGMAEETSVTTGTCEPSGGGVSHWLAADAEDSDSLVEDYDSLGVPMYAGACGQPGGLSGQGDRYLSVETSLDAALWRTVNPVVGTNVEPRVVGESLTFDFLAILGPLDEEPYLNGLTTAPDGGSSFVNSRIRRNGCICLLDDKLAVYLLEDEETGDVRLCVRAGLLQFGKVQEVEWLYDPEGLDPDAWNRVSIKAMTMEGYLRFFVYFNGVKLSDEAYYARPQAEAATSIAALGFVGCGCVDNIVISEEDPVFAGEQTYEVVYNPGTYGSGLQQTASKTNGVALTLKGAIFTRTGYTQTGWSTSPAGISKNYNLGAPYTTDAAITLYPYWTANTYPTIYVAAGGSDAQSGAEGSPLATIQAAIDRASAGCVILVGPGTYAPIETAGKRLVIRGAEGQPGLTVIDGGGTNRCAHLGSTTNTVLENLTLRNGAAGYWSPYDGYVRYEENGGGAYGGTLVNCHVVGNKARNGGGCFDTVLRNCKVCGNAASEYGGGACYRYYFGGLAADGCHLRGNSVGVIDEYGRGAGSALYFDFGARGKVRNCIVAENVCGGYGDGGAVASDYGDTDCVLQNCTVVNNRGGMAGGNRAVGVYGFSLVNSIIRFNLDEGDRESDIPEFGSRLTISGCCVSTLPHAGEYTGSGNTTSDPEFVDLARHVYRLQAGSPCLNAGVTVSDAGATDAMGRARISDSRIDMGACEGAASGAVVTCEVIGEGLVLEPGDVLASNESITFTAAETSRRFMNFSLRNGSATTNKVTRLTNVLADTTVFANFERRTFYVDASRPNSLGDGLSWGTAKKTIAAALALCVRNDEVIVADGTYGAMTVSVEGVTIRSVNGPERTVIDGGGTGRCVTFSGTDGGDLDAVLEGFTLCNGWTAYAGGGANGGTLKRCIVRDNVAGTSGGGLYGCRAENTIVVRNTAESFGGGAASSTLVSCSVAGNRTKEEKGGGLYYGRAVNTVVWGNEAAGVANEYSNGSFTNCVTTPLPSGSANRTVDPRLVDAVNGDVRLRTGSPLKDAGNSSFVAGTLDVYGNARVQGAKVDVGAIEGGEVSGHVVSVRVKGIGDVSPRTAVVGDGGSVTLTAVETSRPFSHYLLYGLKMPDATLPLAELTSDLTITAVFTPYTFYVDASAKTSGDGLSWATAKRTIQEAVNVAETDETVRVAPGTYPPISTHNKRIVIESEKGPAVTVIDGDQTNRCATLADNSSGRATVLRGFTLTHGVLKGSSVYGGGAYAGTLDRCIVSNCQLIGTSSTTWGQGAGLAYSKAVNTLIVNNIASNYVSYAGTYYADLKNCTVTGNRAVSGTWQYGGTYYGSADNCIIWGNVGLDRNNSHGTALKYCCVDSSSTSRGTGCVVADPKFVDAVNGDYRLSVGSPCIDAGLLGDADVGAVDLDGLARVVNGKIDIGAYEWQNGVVIPRFSETAVVIPQDWFSTGKIGGRSVFSPSTFATLFGTDTAAAAKMPTGKVDAHGNPMYVWQDFIAGTDPTDMTSEFKASIGFEDGKPVITWTPDLNEGGTRSIRTYRTLGINDLSQSADPAAWREVAPGNESAYKFFKVEVDLK